MLANLPIAGQGALRVGPRHPICASVVMAFRECADATQDGLSAFSRINPDTTILNTGPGTWLILSSANVSLLPDLDEVAVTFDQGDGYAVLRLHGDAATAVLQKGIFVDLETALAEDGSCVNSVVAHVNVTVWRISADSIGIAVPRSFAGSFWHWLTAAAASAGLSIGR
jgi:sarcosine oxidase subunit gamma